MDTVFLVTNEYPVTRLPKLISIKVPDGLLPHVGVGGGLHSGGGGRSTGFGGGGGDLMAGALANIAIVGQVRWKSAAVCVGGY